MPALDSCLLDNLDSMFLADDLVDKSSGTSIWEETDTAAGPAADPGIVSSAFISSVRGDNCSGISIAGLTSF
jgi:hypothetical protein